MFIYGIASSLFLFVLGSLHEAPWIEGNPFNIQPWQDELKVELTPLVLAALHTAPSVSVTSGQVSRAWDGDNLGFVLLRAPFEMEV